MDKAEMEKKGLIVNMVKTKIMVSGINLHSDKYPCGVCRKGVGRNATFCSGCLGTLGT